MQNDIASSSGSNVRSSLIGMGFSPSIVNKVIEEKGILLLFLNEYKCFLLAYLIEVGKGGARSKPRCLELESQLGLVRICLS